MITFGVKVFAVFVDWILGAFLCIVPLLYVLRSLDFFCACLMLRAVSIPLGVPHMGSVKRHVNTPISMPCVREVKPFW